MSYRLPHDLAGEQQRLALMSALLDPFERVYFERPWASVPAGAAWSSAAAMDQSPRP